MKSKTGSLAKLVNSLKLANINIHAIAQGSSERSVTFAVKAEDEIRGVQAMHRHYNSESDDIAIAVVGAGNIGKAFIKQVKKTYEKWYAKGINLVLVGATNSKQMRVSYENLLFENITILKTPIHIKAIINQLEFIKNKTNFGVYLMGGVSKITENDFNLIKKSKSSPSLFLSNLRFSNLFL